MKAKYKGFTLGLILTIGGWLGSGVGAAMPILLFLSIFSFIIGTGLTILTFTLVIEDCKPLAKAYNWLWSDDK